MTKMITIDEYRKAHAASNIEVGDRVKVLRRAASHEQGWGTVWSDSMDEAIGQTLSVIENQVSRGFTLTGGFNFPWFVLELIEKKKHNPITIDFDTGCLDQRLAESAVNAIAREEEFPSEVYASDYFYIFSAAKIFCREIAKGFNETDVLDRLPEIFNTMRAIIDYRTGRM